MNFYDVLAAEKWGGGIPTINFFDLLFAQSISGGQWKTYEGTLPATLYANGDDMRQYRLYGATGGVGDKTVQLFDKNATDTTNGYVNNAYLNSSGQVVNFGVYPVSHWQISEYISVEPNESYYQKSVSTHQSPCLCEYDSSFAFLKATSFGGNDYVEITTTAQTRFVRLSAWDDNTNNFTTFTKGSTPPASFVPFGYVVPIGVKSAQMFDKNAKNVNNGYMPQTYLYSDGSTSSSPTYKWYVTEYINVSGCAALYCNVVIGTVKTPAICFYDSEKNYISGEIYNYRANFSVTVPQNAVYCRASVNGSPDEDSFMIAPGSTAPYQPYSNTVTPIYIGDTQLEKDEYVDYQAQKVYHMIDGTLTPTDPPVALPALPTCDGTTIVDYTGSGTAPEKVYFEYKGGKQS